MKQLSEIAFFTDDVARMKAFYTAFLGAEPVAHSSGMAIFMVGHTKIFIHQNYTPDEGELPPENHFAFEVGGVDAACQSLTQAGVVVEVEPRSYYWGRSAYLRDPDGHLIELIQAEEEDNTATVRRLWEEVWNRRNFDLVDEIMSPDYAEHERRFAPVLLASFPDTQFILEEMIAEGDKVVSRVTFRGTHQGEYRGIPATNKQVEVKGVWIHRLDGGRIVEGKQWGFVDWLGLMRQLGATITPPTAE